MTAATGKLRLVDTAPKPRKSKPVKDYRAWLKSKGYRRVVIERTPKSADEKEFNHRGELVACRVDFAEAGR